MQDKARILVVDDEPLTLQGTALLLRNEGYEVLEASTGSECLESLRGELPDIVLLDVILPDLDGREVCRQIKADPRTAGTMVVLISSVQVSSEEAADGLEVGADGYIARPVSVKELLARVRSMVRILRAEEELRRTSDEWAATFDAIQDLVSIHGRDFTILRANRAFAEAFGLKPGEIPGARCFELFHGAGEPPASCVHGRALEGGRPVREEFFEPHLHMHLEVSCSPILDEKGEAFAVVHVAKDVTARKRAEEALLRTHDDLESMVEMRTAELVQTNEWLAEEIEEHRRVEDALRESEAKFRAIFEGTAVGAVLTDGSGRVVESNPALRRILGYSADELRSRTISELTYPEDDERLGHLFEDLVRGRRDLYQVEKRYLRKDGEVVWGRLTASAIRGTGGSPFLGVGVIEDVTERMRMEAEAQNLREEISHVTRVSLMGELTASLAHELNQPLTAILSNAQTAQRLLGAGDPDLEEIREILADIVSDDRRASEVIRRLRALLKKGALESQPLDLNDLARDVAGLVRSDAILKNVALRQEPAPSLPAIRGDRVQLQQVILNLVLNALDAAKESPGGERWLSIATSPSGERAVRLTVRDSGPGIPADRLDRIFEPFFTTKSEGMGMGLVIASSIVRSHGGRLWAENVPGGGAAFTVELPSMEAEP